MNSRRDFLQKLTASAIALPLSQYIDRAIEKNDPAYSNKKLYDGPVLRVAIMR